MNEETTTILIDTALASGSATALDPEERALQELVLQIRDGAPTPAADFKLRMDARVAAGFPRRRARTVRMPALVVRRPHLAILGAAASLLIALIVAGSLSGGGSETRSASVAASNEAAKSAPASSAAAGSAGGGGAVQSATRAAAPKDVVAGAGTAVAPSVTPIEPPISPGPVRGGQSRRVERSAALVLAAPEDKFSQVGDQIIAVTDRYGGIVMHSSVTDVQSGQGTGSFDLRIPQRNLQPALRDLSALADVQSRTQSADDVTASFVSARTHIQELEAERTRLLKQLAAATNDNQAAAIRARIRIVNGELNSATQALHQLSRQTSFATVSVTLNVKHGGSTGGGGIGRGVDDLRDTLIGSAVIALRVLGVLIPIALVVALLWAGNSRLTRRNREAALDSRL